jgi:hypothetical protein
MIRDNRVIVAVHSLSILFEVKILR